MPTAALDLPVSEQIAWTRFHFGDLADYAYRISQRHLALAGSSYDLNLELAHPLPIGRRTEVWIGYLEGGERRVVARRSVRSERSRVWEWTLL